MTLQNTNPPSSSQSTHRLPTFSASQALRTLRISGPRAISTGLKKLDALLQPRTATPGQGGLSRGQVTEIYGPPGSGKTALGLQAAKNALQRGGHVVWIDTATSVSKTRLEALLFTSPSRPEGPSSSIDETLSAADMLPRFHHYSTRTLAHLIALTAHPVTAFPPEGTSLVVIDSVSTLFDHAYPRTSAAKGNKNDNSKWAAGRRYAVMSSLVSTLGKIAAVRDIPVLLTNQVVTRFREESHALLVPAMAGLEWDNGIATRLVVFQDWPPDPGRLAGMDDDKRKKIRYIGVIKVAGIGLNAGDGLGAVIPFIVEPSGLSDVDLRTVEVPLETLTSPARPSATRRLNEVPDSEDELSSDEMYGWGEDDELAAEGLLIDEAALAAERSDEKSDQPPQKRTRTEEPASRISPEQE